MHKIHFSYAQSRPQQNATTIQLSCSTRVGCQVPSEKKVANIVLYTLFWQAPASGFFYKALFEVTESADIVVLKPYLKLKVCLAALSG